MCGSPPRTSKNPGLSLYLDGQETQESYCILDTVQSLRDANAQSRPFMISLYMLRFEASSGSCCFLNESHIFRSLPRQRPSAGLGSEDDAGCGVAKTLSSHSLYIMKAKLRSTAVWVGPADMRISRLLAGYISERSTCAMVSLTLRPGFKVEVSNLESRDPVCDFVHVRKSQVRGPQNSLLDLAGRSNSLSIGGGGTRWNGIPAACRRPIITARAKL